MSDRTRVVVGAEWDEDLRTRLLTVLQDMGTTAGGSTWTVGGSQELEVLQVSVRGQPVVVEAETYVGLTLTGPTDLVKEIQARVSAMQDDRASPERISERLLSIRKMIVAVLDGRVTRETAPELWEEDGLRFGVQRLEREDAEWLSSEVGNRSYPPSGRVAILICMTSAGQQKARALFTPEDFDQARDAHEPGTTS
jgi:hypothetical protein